MIVTAYTVVIDSATLGAPELLPVLAGAQSFSPRFGDRSSVREPWGGNHGEQAPEGSYNHYSPSLKAKPHRNYLLGPTENSKQQKEVRIKEES